MKKMKKLLLLSLFIIINNPNINANPVIEAAKSGSPKLENIDKYPTKTNPSQKISDALSQIAPFIRLFDINDSDEEGNTILHYIANYDFEDFVDCLWLLVKNYKNLNLNIKNKNSNTPMTEAIKNEKHNNAAILSCLGAKFIEINSKQTMKNTEQEDEIYEEISVLFPRYTDELESNNTFIFDEKNFKIIIQPIIDKFNSLKEKDDSKLDKTEQKIKQLLSNQD